MRLLGSNNNTKKEMGADVVDGGGGASMVPTGNPCVSMTLLGVASAVPVLNGDNGCCSAWKTSISSPSVGLLS